jgi:hypothetical protein
MGAKICIFANAARQKTGRGTMLRGGNLRGRMTRKLQQAACLP